MKRTFAAVLLAAAATFAAVPAQAGAFNPATPAPVVEAGFKFKKFGHRGFHRRGIVSKRFGFSRRGLRSQRFGRAFGHSKGLPFVGKHGHRGKVVIIK